MRNGPDATQLLIRRLASDAAHAPARDVPVLAIFSLAALAALVPVLVLLGLRGDLANGMAGLGALKIAAGGLAAVCAAVACVQLVRPDGSRSAGLLLVPGFLAFFLPMLINDVPSDAIGFWSDPAGPACFVRILAFALLPLGTILVGLRTSAPVNPLAAGLGAGALAGGLAAFAYALSCTADTVAVASFWYPAGMAATTLLGGLLGSRWFAW